MKGASDRLATLVAFAALLAACNNSGGGSPPPSLTVLTTSPPTGATDVEPSTPIELVLAANSAPLRAADLVVTDGDNRLPGAVARIGTTDRWSWTPAGELPRGATIRVKTASQGEIASFSVREIRLGAQLELPGEQVENTLSWDNGRRAVRTQSGRVFELTGGTPALVERFVTMPAGARAYGNGRFLGEQVDAGVRYCVRGGLDGGFDRVPTPLGVPLGDLNANGDVVAFVPGDLGSPAEQGLWRLRRDQVAFELVGPRSLAGVVDRPSIEADGTVSIAWAENGAPRLARFVPGNLAGQDYTLVLDASLSLLAAGLHYDASDDGRGVLAFVVGAPPVPGGLPERWVARAARFDPAVGLGVLATELETYLPFGLSSPGTNHYFRVENVVAGDHGSAAVVTARGYSSTQSGSWQASVDYHAIRVDAGDRVAVPHLLVGLTPIAVPPLPYKFNELRASPGRAEVWASQRTSSPSGFALSRSRPGGVVFDTVPTLYSDRAYPDWSFAFDDSGRGILAAEEYMWQGPLLGPLLGTRIFPID
ncbi:MAG: hypothetical protein MUC36_18965 [Planctomycetes bacterium]|jgi:hypothetical protein|nr:hypothetical protein [Planctomycetota bacterium]